MLPRDVLTRGFLIENYINKRMSSDDLADKLGFGQTTILRHLKRYNLTRTNSEGQKNKFYKTHNVSILYEMCPFTAYFLGFLITDGSLGDYNNHKHIAFAVGEKSSSVLSYFASVLGGNVNRYDYSENKDSIHTIEYHYSLYNEELFDLINKKYNIFPRKTYNCSFPDYVQDDLMQYFFRGAIDGDGWITSDRNRMVLGYVSASKNYIDNFLDYLCNKFIIRKPKITNIRKIKNLYYSFCFSHKYAIKICSWIYKDLLEGNPQTFALPYKYERFLKYF